MDETIKKLLLENSSKRIDEIFANNDDSGTKFAKAISDVSIKATVIVLEEYEKLIKR